MYLAVQRERGEDLRDERGIPSPCEDELALVAMVDGESEVQEWRQWQGASRRLALNPRSVGCLWGVAHGQPR